jgi:hypothetical protein
MAAKKLMCVLFGMLIISVWILGSPIQAGAENHKYRVSSYVLKLEILPVGDVEGHIIGFYFRKGLAHFETGETGTIRNCGTADYIKGSGPVQFYSIVTFEDGSTIVGKYEGTVERNPKGHGLAKGTGEYTKGTGRFAGIKGKFTWAGKSITAYSKEKETLGDFYYDVNATYTLPSK